MPTLPPRVHLRSSIGTLCTLHGDPARILNVPVLTDNPAEVTCKRCRAILNPVALVMPETHAWVPGLLNSHHKLCTFQATPRPVYGLAPGANWPTCVACQRWIRRDTP